MQEIPSVQQPTQDLQANTIGKPVQVGDRWMVTVNSVKTHAGEKFSHPKGGYSFLVVDVTLKNISSGTHNASSVLMFTLKDQAGQRYTETMTGFAKASPDGKVKSGDLLRGELVYAVPSSMHTYSLAFAPRFLTHEMAEWKLTV
jgi:Domain of unknown function (DUF4352)